MPRGRSRPSSARPDAPPGRQVGGFWRAGSGTEEDAGHGRQVRVASCSASPRPGWDRAAAGRAPPCGHPDSPGPAAWPRPSLQRPKAGPSASARPACLRPPTPGFRDAHLRLHRHAASHPAQPGLVDRKLCGERTPFRRSAPACRWPFPAASASRSRFTARSSAASGRDPASLRRMRPDRMAAELAARDVQLLYATRPSCGF